MFAGQKVSKKDHFKYMYILRRFSNTNSHETKEKNRYKGIGKSFILGW